MSFPRPSVRCVCGCHYARKVNVFFGRRRGDTLVRPDTPLGVNYCPKCGRPEWCEK